MTLNESRSRMPSIDRVLSGLFWFLVNCLALSTATLPFLAIERSMDHWGPHGYALLIAAAGAFVSMWLLIAGAMLVERAASHRRKRTRQARETSVNGNSHGGPEAYSE